MYTAGACGCVCVFDPTGQLSRVHAAVVHKYLCHSSRALMAVLWPFGASVLI